MKVLFISPGFPAEMPRFVRGLAQVGAEVIGLGEQPLEAVAPGVRDCLSDYIQAESLWDAERTLDQLRDWSRNRTIDRIECLWELGVELAARLREGLGVPGMGLEQALLFRDKEAMKQALDRAGIRTPRHRKATSEAECRTAAEEVGFPLIVKPIAGAGSADTHRVDDNTELERVLPLVRHVRELSVEEFIAGEEYTFDTICARGEVLYHNISWYRPCPLIARTLEWVSPQTISLRDVDAPALAGGVDMGRAVLDALGFEDGFTHMEWFRTEAGEAVFGEIGARPPGAMSVDIMNFAGDIDTYVGWAEATCDGRLSQPVERRYNAAVIFKRARGEGRVSAIHGLQRLISRYRSHIVSVDLLPVGAPRRNWKSTLLSDGNLILRHADLGRTIEMADRVGCDLQMFAD